MRTTLLSAGARLRKEALHAASAAAAAPVQLTAQEYELYSTELRALRAARTTVLVRLMREAHGLVAADATEELAQLQAGQAAADMRIARLDRMLARCEIVHRDLEERVVYIGCEVELEFTRSGARKRFELNGIGFGPSGRTGTQRITARSPVGQAILGSTIGDAVVADLPGGRSEELVILDITAPTEAPDRR